MAEADDIVARLSWLCSPGAEATSDGERLTALIRAGQEAATALAERDAQIERLTKLVYVPGLWKCPKCKFSLVQANLNASDGTVTARDKPGDKCPNCASPLWRVTERDAGNEIIDRAEEYIARATTAERERDEARAEVERKDAALLRIAKRCSRPDLVARAALTKGGENGEG